jgi:hypothetical protein
MTALARNAERRFQSAQEFSQALDALQMAASPEQVSEFVQSLGTIREEPSVGVGSEPSNPALEEREEEELTDSNGITVVDPVPPSRLEPVTNRFRLPTIALITVLAGLGTTLVVSGRASSLFGKAPDVEGISALASDSSQNKLEIEIGDVEVVRVPTSKAPVVARATSRGGGLPEVNSSNGAGTPAAAKSTTNGSRVGTPAAKPSKKSERPVVRASTTSRPHRAPKGAGGSKASKCNPPTYLDGEGIRHYKKECL